MQITDKHVLITGANRGIGLAFAQAAAQKSAHLLLVMRKKEEKIDKSLIDIGARSVKILCADLSERSGVESLVKQLENQQVDLLFNNAGLLTGGLIEEQPIDDIYRMFQVNINALVHLTHEILPRMIKQKSGKIINHASVSAVMHLPCASTYAASKAAVWAFTDCLQQELNGTGVSTLCLFTPGVKTEMFNQIDVLYSKNFETPKDSISPSDYALKIMAAVESDQVYLEPSGTTGVAFTVATHFKGLFNRIAGTRFHR